MDNTKLCVVAADAVRSKLDNVDEELKKVARTSRIISINNFMSDPKQPVHFVDSADKLFEFDEIADIVRQLLEGGYIVLLAKGYFCVEVPSKTGRAPGLYMGDDSPKDKYTEKGFTVIDI